MLGNVTFCDDAYACAQGASALVIVTEWEQFRALDFERLKAVMARPVLVDLRNIYRPEEVRARTASPMRAWGGARNDLIRHEVVMPREGGASSKHRHRHITTFAITGSPAFADDDRW